MQPKSNMWIWIILLLAAIGAAVYFFVLPKMKPKASPNNPPKPDNTGNTNPTTTTTHNTGGGGGSTNNNGNSGGNTGNTTSGNLLPVYNLHYKTKVVNLAKGSAQAKLAQYITKEGLKAFGLADTVGAIDGKIGPKTKSGITALIGTLPLPMQIFTVNDITLEGLAKLVNAKINGANEPIETGISRITYSLLK